MERKLNKKESFFFVSLQLLLSHCVLCVVVYLDLCWYTASCELCYRPRLARLVVLQTLW